MLTCVGGCRYINSLYWSVTTMATVGYGDIVAISIPEKVVAMVAEVIGASVFAYFMSAMATLVAALNVSRTR
jgi:voltage-gated potassium channel Kch